MARDPLIDLAGAHHPLQLLGAGLFAQLCGYVDPNGHRTPPVPVHIAEHAYLTLLHEPGPWTRVPAASAGLVVADWADAARDSIRRHEQAGALRSTVAVPSAIFGSAHHRLSAGQLLWWDPVLVEAEVARLPTLLAYAQGDIERVSGVNVDAWLAIWKSSAS